jgi:hypothetical protein
MFLTTFANIAAIISLLACCNLNISNFNFVFSWHSIKLSLCIVSAASILNRSISVVESASLSNEFIKFLSTLARLAGVELIHFSKTQNNFVARVHRVVSLLCWPAPLDGVGSVHCGKCTQDGLLSPSASLQTSVGVLEVPVPGTGTPWSIAPGTSLVFAVRLRISSILLYQINFTPSSRKPIPVWLYNLLILE